MKNASHKYENTLETAILHTDDSGNATIDMQKVY